MVMYKIDRRVGGGGGVQKSYIRTDPSNLSVRFKYAFTILILHDYI